MSQVVEVIANNIKRLRDIKGLSQKEIYTGSGIPQGQYSRIENGKVEPSVSTLDKLSKVLKVSISEFFITNDVIEEVNLSLLEKVKLINKLAPDEQQALLKMIDLAISNKRMKDNLSNLINE